jgi:hypothetical protein
MKRHTLVRVWDKNMEDLTVEEICKKINIQANLIDLQSKNKKRINSALTTLATITSLTKRRDALYALCGYYLLEIEHIDEIEFFFDAIRNLDSMNLAPFGRAIKLLSS